MRMPALFIGHGSPMIAIEENEYTRQWEALGKRFQPKAILAISGHWYTDGLKTQDVEKPKKIDDMYGFPRALYDMTYDVSGDQELTQSLEDILGDQVSVDNSWGIDHGAWSVLVHMYPHADIPVVQLSVNRHATPQEQFEIGEKLSTLRDQGYMVFASGNVVHNLRMANPSATSVNPLAKTFDDAIEDAIKKGDYETVIHYDQFGQAARFAAPTPDHFMPLLSVLGASRDDDQLEVLNKGYDFGGAVTMTGYLFTEA